MTGQEKITLAGVVVALVGLFIREWHTRTIERTRSQPVVIAHEFSPMGFDPHAEWSASAFLTNDGGGTAFNVRFGIEMRGVRYASHLETSDPISRNRQRVVPVGKRFPTPERSR